MNRRRALIRRPSPRLSEGIVTHIERTEADPDLALRQWQSYVDALHAHGWETREVAPADDCPDGVFIEDPVFVYGDLAIICRSGAPERREELPGVEEAARAEGYRIAHITEPGTVDGGDILKFGGKVWIGQGGRSNDEGIRQLTELLAPLGAEVIPVPLTKVLHLKSGVTKLPDGTTIGYLPLVDDASAWESFLEVPEEAGSHVVLLDENTVLMSASAPQTAELFRERGLNVVTVDISEFERLEGCVTCLSVRLRG